MGWNFKNWEENLKRSAAKEVENYLEMNKGMGTHDDENKMMIG